MLLITKII